MKSKQKKYEKFYCPKCGLLESFEIDVLKIQKSLLNETLECGICGSRWIIKRIRK